MDEHTSAVDDALINAATDRLVDATDSRLRGYGNYRKQLRRSVKTAVVYIINMIEALPPPVEISRSTFSSDPRLQLFLHYSLNYRKRLVVQEVSEIILNRHMKTSQIGYMAC